MGQEEMCQIVEFIDRIIQAPDDTSIALNIRNEIKEMCHKFPIYSGLADEVDN